MFTRDAIAHWSSENLKKKGDIEFNTIVKIIIAAVVLLICIGMIIFFKDLLWDKFETLKNTLNLG